MQSQAQVSPQQALPRPPLGDAVRARQPEPGRPMDQEHRSSLRAPSAKTARHSIDPMHATDRYRLVPPMDALALGE